MTAHLRVLALALLLHLAAPASALKWAAVGAPLGSRGWLLAVQPTGFGYAASRDGLIGDWFDEIYRTTDGGKTWLSVPLSGIDGVDAFGGFMTTAGAGSTTSVVALGWAANKYGDPSQPLLWSPATAKWSNHTVAAPATAMQFQALVPVPGGGGAFAMGYVDTSGSRTSYVLYWNGAANNMVWKIIKQVSGSIDELVVGSSTAAWISYGSPVDIDRWTGTAWVKQRKGTANDLYVNFLKAVPAAGTTAPAVWVKQVAIPNGVWTETLLLCGTAGCASKKSAATIADFAAASTTFALVWEKVRNATTSVETAHLQHFDGTKWTTRLQLPIAQGEYIRARLSVASATRAVSMFIAPAPGNTNTNRLITHTWNGASWALHTDATATDAQLFYSRLHALDSGSALLQMRNGLWRLG